MMTMDDLLQFNKSFETSEMVMTQIKSRSSHKRYRVMVGLGCGSAVSGRVMTCDLTWMAWHGLGRLLHPLVAMDILQFEIY